MRRINAFGFVTLGKALVPLHSLNEHNAKYGDIWLFLWEARVQLGHLLSNESLRLHTSRPVAERLVNAITKVVSLDLSEAMGLQAETLVGWWEVQQVKSEVAKFETVLAEELSLLDAYVIAQKGVYSTHDLILNADAMLSLADRLKLSARTIDDLCEAGKCLAFETPTAACFHLMRALESVILLYYAKVLGKAPPSRMRNWGMYIKSLRNSGLANEKIVDFLDHIRQTYRNPVSHPEVMVSVDDAQILFGVACSSISQMAREL